MGNGGLIAGEHLISCPSCWAKVVVKDGQIEMGGTHIRLACGCKIDMATIKKRVGGYPVKVS